MSAYVTRQEVREKAGFQFKERDESLGNGDGTTVTFLVANKPIVDSNKSDSVTTADITAYVSGSPVTVSAIVASLGKITLASAPASGSPITVDYDWSEISDSLIDEYLADAHSLVVSYLAEVYSMPLSSTPDIVKSIEKMLAAGYLLDKEYSVGGDESQDHRGARWIKDAMKLLKDISEGRIELRDDNGNVITQKSTGTSIEGWPDDTTKDASEANAGGDIKFTIKQKF